MWLGLIAAGVAAAGATACPPDVPPDWLEKPSGADIAWVYPPKAVEEERGGLVTVACELNIEGLTEHCLVISEQPRGYGFGNAALMLTDFMKFTPSRECGRIMRGDVRIPLTFAPPEGLQVLPSTPQAQAVARRLLVLIGTEEALNDRFELELQMAYGAHDGDSEMTVEQRRASYEAARETWATVKEKAFGALVSSFAGRLSQETLEEGVAFYGSPAGQALASHMRREIALSRDPLITPALVEAFRQRYCAKVTPCAPVSKPAWP